MGIAISKENPRNPEAGAQMCLESVLDFLHSHNHLHHLTHSRKTLAHTQGYPGQFFKLKILLLKQVTMVTFSCFVLLDPKNVLTPARVFVLVNVMNILKGLMVM